MYKFTFSILVLKYVEGIPGDDGKVLPIKFCGITPGRKDIFDFEGVLKKIVAVPGFLTNPGKMEMVRNIIATVPKLSKEVRELLETNHVDVVKCKKEGFPITDVSLSEPTMYFVAKGPLGNNVIVKQSLFEDDDSGSDVEVELQGHTRGHTSSKDHAGAKSSNSGKGTKHFNLSKYLAGKSVKTPNSFKPNHARPGKYIIHYGDPETLFASKQEIKEANYIDGLQHFLERQAAHNAREEGYGADRYIERGGRIYEYDPSLGEYVKSDIDPRHRPDEPYPDLPNVRGVNVNMYCPLESSDAIGINYSATDKAQWLYSRGYLSDEQYEYCRGEAADADNRADQARRNDRSGGPDFDDLQGEGYGHRGVGGKKRGHGRR